MKRELAYALEAQSHLTESLGRTRSAKPKPDDIPHKLNGSIDLSPEIKASINECSALGVYRRNKRLKASSENGDCVMAEEPKGDSEGGSAAMVGKRRKKEVVGTDGPRRFTRSALKVQNGENVNVETEMVKEEVLKAEENVNSWETKFLEEIELKRIPKTVRELLETSLLEDYPVFYSGSGKKEFALRGAIKGTGILCYCSLCKGSTVVPPSTFEIHACKVYKRAAQYICLENGKSLLEVVKACNKYSLKTLATNIQSIVGPLTRKESTTCQSCNGSFLVNRDGNTGQICDSCMDSMKLQANATKTTEIEARSSSSVVVYNSTASDKVPGSSGRITKGNRNIKSSGPDLASLVPRRSSVRVLSREKTQTELPKKSVESALVPDSPGTASVRNLLRSKKRGRPSKKMVSVPESDKKNKKEKLSKKIASVAKSPLSAPLQKRSWKKNSKKISNSIPFRSASKTASSSKWKITKKDQKMHKLIFEDQGLPDGTVVAYFSRGKKLLDGYKRGAGIVCHCCNTEISPSQFEAHAGWASRRKPYSYIYITNGVSLHEYALSLLLKRKTNSAKDNDDLCIICADGGNLLLCDGCPRSFHQECASLPAVPRGKWYCQYCQNMFQREKYVAHNANAVAAGRVSGVDVIGQITERCIRIVKTPEEAEVIACVLCRGYDFSKSGFGPRTVILCDQCEKEYHVGCLKKHKMADLKELPKGKWFCCWDCKRIYSALQNLLVAEAEKLPDSLLDITRKKHSDKGLEGITNIDVSWRLLSAKISSRENRLLLSKAVAIFHDCFDPIVDSVSGRDFIPSMVYGRNIRGQDFGGMYCAILTVNSSVVSAGLLRVFGADIAELPLVATTKGNQDKGYFKLLFSCIEKLLAFLNVRSLVLPAAEEAESIWITKFGFGKIPVEQLDNYRKRCWQMLTFQGTAMLEKEVPRCLITRHNLAAEDVSPTVDNVTRAIDFSLENQDDASLYVSIGDQDAAAGGRSVDNPDPNVDDNPDLNIDVSFGDEDVAAVDNVDVPVGDKDVATVDNDVSSGDKDVAIIDVSVENQDAAVIGAAVVDVPVEDQTN